MLLTRTLKGPEGLPFVHAASSNRFMSIAVTAAPGPSHSPSANSQLKLPVGPLPGEAYIWS